MNALRGIGAAVRRRRLLKLGGGLLLLLLLAGCEACRAIHSISPSPVPNEVRK